jgi:hypothetical protein
VNLAATRAHLWVLAVAFVIGVAPVLAAVLFAITTVVAMLAVAVLALGEDAVARADEHAGVALGDDLEALVVARFVSKGHSQCFTCYLGT